MHYAASVRWRHWRQLFAVAASILLSRPASATPQTYHDDVQPFSVTLPFSATQIPCVTIPRSERLPGCDKILGRPPKVATAERVLVGVTILEGSWTSGVVVSEQTREHVGELDSDAIESLAKQVATSIESLGAPLLPGPRGVRWTVKTLKINGQDVVRFVANRAVSNEDPYGRFILHSVYHRNYAHHILVIGPLAHENELDAFAEATVRSVQAPPSDVDHFGESRAARGLHRAFAELWPYAAGAALLSIALIARDRRRRRDALAANSRSVTAAEPISPAEKS